MRWLPHTEINTEGEACVFASLSCRMRGAALKTSRSVYTVGGRGERV